jgi:hypothetical protein
MTVMHRLRSAGFSEAEAQRAASTIGAFLPVGRKVLVTDEILEAARVGNSALVAILLADEDEPEPGEIDAVTAARQDDTGERFTIAQIRAEFAV